MVYVYLQQFCNGNFMAGGSVIPNLFTNYTSHDSNFPFELG